MKIPMTITAAFLTAASAAGLAAAADTPPGAAPGAVSAAAARPVAEAAARKAAMVVIGIFMQCSSLLNGRAQSLRRIPQPAEHAGWERRPVDRDDAGVRSES